MMFRLVFALLAIVCFFSSTKFAQARRVWWDKDLSATELEEAAETARFNPFLYALPNQLAEYLRISPTGTHETEFGLEDAFPQDVEIQYDPKARQPPYRRRQTLRTTTTKPKRKPINRRPKPTQRPLVTVKPHRIPKDPPIGYENIEGIKEPETVDYEYSPSDIDFEAENFYSRSPPMLPYWALPYPSLAAYYGYAPQIQQFEMPAQAQQQAMPQPQQTPQSTKQTLPHFQLQIPADENTLQLLQLALLLQQTLATAAAAAAEPLNVAAAEVPINGATAVATSEVTPTVLAPAAAVLAVTSSPVVVAPAPVASLPAVAATVIPQGAPKPTVETLMSLVQSPQIQQSFALATAGRPFTETVNTAIASAVAATQVATVNVDDLVIGDSNTPASFDDSLKSIAASDDVEPKKEEEVEEVSAAESEMIVEPAKIADNPMPTVDSPVLYLRAPTPAIKRPSKPVKDLAEEIVSPSDILTAEKEIVATVPYYHRADDATMAEDYHIVGQRYIKPIGYRPDSPDNFQGRKRGESRA